MSTINKVILLGNITRPLELHYTPKGTAACDLGLALNRRWRTDSGEQKEATTFVECRLWGKSAETAAQHLTKGAAVLIEGRLEQDTWLDKTTQKPRSKTLVIVEAWQFGAPKRQPAPAHANTPDTTSPFDGEDQD